MGRVLIFDPAGNRYLQVRDHPGGGEVFTAVAKFSMGESGIPGDPAMAPSFPTDSGDGPVLALRGK